MCSLLFECIYIILRVAQYCYIFHNKMIDGARTETLFQVLSVSVIKSRTLKKLMVL